MQILMIYETQLSGDLLDWLTVFGYLTVTGIVVWRVLFAK